MSKFPEAINIKIIDVVENKPIEGIVINLHVFTNRKNDYSMIPSASNNYGEITASNDWIRTEIEKARNLFIMDYSSTIDDCKPYIEIKIMNDEEIIRAINAMKIFQSALKTPDEEIDYLRTAKNVLYKPVSKMLKFDGKDILDVVIETSPSNLTIKGD